MKSESALQNAFALCVIAVLVLLVDLSPATAQEFSPRTYSVAPAGLNFVGIGYGYATGAVMMDPGLPTEDVDAQVHAVFARYVRTFGLLGMPAKARISLPWSSGHWEGLYEGVNRTRDAEGIGDIRLAVETQFLRGGVKTPEQLRGHTPPVVVGLRLQVVVPTGVYDPSRAINIGGNRWTFVPELGVGWNRGKWSIEGAVAVWIFTDNPDFVGGQRFEQDSLLVGKLHVIRSIRPGFWWAIAGGYGYGGQTRIDGVDRATIQRNWRIHASVVYPVTARQGLVLVAGSGGNAGVGSDADAIGIAYQLAW
jgi:hypothetical protein